MPTTGIQRYQVYFLSGGTLPFVLAGPGCRM
jgi:hypothetical protein